MMNRDKAMEMRTMSDKAMLAIKAVWVTKNCGRWAGRRFAMNNGVLGLWRLAMQLEATK